jgi:hypothetical protein
MGGGTYQGGWTDREPKFVGIIPITYAVFVVCALHLVLSITLLSQVITGHPLALDINPSKVLVSPLLQWWYGAFTLLSIVSIVLAAVGALYRLEFHLKVYANLLTVAAGFDFFIFCNLLMSGRQCQSTHVTSPAHMIATMYCGVEDALTLAIVTCIIIFKFISVFCVQKCRAFVKMEDNANLIPFLQAHLRQTRKSERISASEEDQTIQRLKELEAARQAEADGPEDAFFNHDKGSQYGNLAKQNMRLEAGQYGAM